MQPKFTIRAGLVCLVLAVVAYVYGVDSRFAPKNGDEYPYAHIVRLTSAAGSWLPLQSEMLGVKNTKPPLLFWQGMVSTDWGKQWSLQQLRIPSLIYTGLTALLLFFSLWKISKQIQVGLLGAVLWLSFFATYRYGRPYLADPPEVFWLSLPFFGLLILGKPAFQSKFIFPFFAAIALGFGLLYKSFAYVVPACLVLSVWYWRVNTGGTFGFIKQDLLKVLGIGVLSLGIFALWFVVDPNPTAIWNEFILGENVGKFEARSSNYLQDFIWGGDSVGMLWVTSIANTGFLFFTTLAMLYGAVRYRKSSKGEESLLWIWILIFFIVFSLPSQRSARYLLPVMPAVAALIALHWQQLGVWSFRLALFLQILILITLAWLAWNLQTGFVGDGNLTWSYPLWHWGATVGALILLMIGLWHAPWSKSIALLGCFICYGALSSSLMPLDQQLGRFTSDTIKAVQGKTVWFPCDFRAKDEEYRLLLPGATIHGYPANQVNQGEQLARTYPFFATQTPLNASPPVCDACFILGSRVEMRARHSDAEIKSMLLGKVSENLFVREYLIFSPNAKTDLAVFQKNSCR
ncbi:MAG: glycosyl transferase [Polynucleobacter sp.]|jgi:4-amino-4-deoxy-L-arabinose transferase-like glycosyltransferase|nr:glycosyl transferase [Polynucleobacter sp.]